MTRDYGVIRYGQDRVVEGRGRASRAYWFVEAEPHVRVWIRRLFPKVTMRADHLMVTATVQNTADLAWACQRFPMRVDAVNGGPAEWAARIAEHEATQRTLAEIRSGDGRYTPPMFADMALPPRGYQRAGADQALRLRRMLLGDQLGLGKTITALSMLTDPRTRPALIVTMAHLTRQWKRETERFVPGLRAHVLRTARPTYKLEDVGDDGMPDVVISNYQKLDGWAPAIAGMVRSVVFDECQELRTGGPGDSAPAKYKAAKAIADGADFALGMSATPVYNYGSEIWSVYYVLDEDVFGTKREFLDAWCDGAAERFEGGRAKSQPVDDPVALCAHLKETGKLLLRTRAEVGRELPDLQVIVQHCDADLTAIESAKDRVAEMARILLGGTTLSQQERFAYEREIDMRLRQATGVAKAPFAAEFVRLLVESGVKVLLYGYHHAFYDVVMEKLKDLNPAKYTGEESVPQKEEARRRFIEDPECHVLVMSVRAGAGVDGLQQVCHVVVHAELDWSPRVHEQGDGRVHRDGQGEGVISYRLLAEDGSDPVIAAVLGLKEIQSSGIIGREAQVFRTDDSAAQVRKLAEAVLQRRAN